MAPPDTSSRRPRSPFPFNSAVAAFLAAVVLSACAGDGCDCEGFEQTDFPETHYDKTVPKTGQVRVSDTGLQYLEQQIPNIIGQFLPNGLSFCVPQTKPNGSTTICPGSTCTQPQGKKGCQLNLSVDDAEINPAPPDTLEVQMTVGMLNEILPIDAGPLECEVDLHKKGADKDVPAQVPATLPVKFVVDQQTPTNDVSIEVGDVKADVDKLGFEISGRDGIGDDLGCGLGEIASGIDFVREFINDQIKEQLNDAVQGAVQEQMCRKCDPDAPECPDRSSCQTLEAADMNACTWTNGDRTDKCVGRQLGVEGRLMYQALLGEFMEREKAEVDLMAKAADLAEVDSGINLGLRTGFQQTARSECAPIDDMSRPDFSPVAKSTAILSDTKPGSNQSFMLGLGLHKRALEHMFWSTWASGALCFKIGSDFHRLLNTDGISLLVQGIKELTDDKAPIFLRITPQTAPTVELGDNKIAEDGDSYTLEDPLMTLNWQDLDLHFYGYVQERYTRLFTIRTDLEVPVGLRGDGMGKIIPVVGDLDKAAKDIRVRNNRILTDDPDKIEQIIPTLLGAALPQLAGSLDEPIELPEFFGYRLAIDQNDIQSVDNRQFIALYADLVFVGNSKPLMATTSPTITDTRVDAHRTTPEGVPRPNVDLDVASGLLQSGQSNDVEYSYRLDDGVWSRYTRTDTLHLDDPVLALQGRHTVEVRARKAGTPGTASDPVTTSFLVDYDAPSLDIERDGGHIRLVGSDTVDDPNQMDYRWRAIASEGGSGNGWSTWSSQRTLDPSRIDATGQVTIVGQARDRSGHETEAKATVDLERVRAVAVTERDEAAGSSDAPPEATGCSSVPTGDSGPGPLGWLTALVFGALGWCRRRNGRRRRASSSRTTLASLGLLVVLVAAPGLAGCSNDKTAEQNQCDPACENWETCEEGGCVSDGCSSNDECPDGATCRDGQCRERECQTGDDCDCADDRRGTCMNGMCSCKHFCPDGCGEDEYCCYADNECQSLPDPCRDTSCDPGFQPEVVEPGTPDNKTCEVSGGECECVEKPPLDLRWYGQYAGIDSNDDAGVTAVSAYNRYFGDLMVGVLDDELEPTWYFPDGAPKSGTPEAAPSGPRGGLTDKGDDVGTHTAIAVDSEGTVHVLYRSEKTGALKYARGTQNSDGYAFETTKLDDEGTTGLHTSLTVRDGTLYASYGVESIDVEVPVDDDTGSMGDAGMGGSGGDSGMGGETRTVEHSQLRHIGFPVDTPIDQLDLKAEIVHEAGPANPCDSSCSGDGEVCFKEAGMCAKPTDDCGTECGEGMACRMASCVPAYDPPDTPSRPAMTGLYSDTRVTADGRVVVAFYDHIQKRVGWAWREADGTWRDPQFLDERSGPYASAAIDPDGQLHLAYMDPTTRSLRHLTVGSMQKPEAVTDGIRNSGGEYLDATIGQNVNLHVADDGSLRVTFHDATKHRLVAATRGAMGNWSQTTLADPGSDGNYNGAHGFFAAFDGTVAAEMVINVQNGDKPDAYMEFREVGP